MAAVLKAVDDGFAVDWPMQPIDADNEVTFYAAQNHFAIGTLENYVCVPLDPPTAERICRLKGWTFPTKKMVEMIFDQSDCKVYAKPGGAGPWGPPYNREMFSVDRIAAFNERTQKQIAEIEKPVAALLAGHRKNLVLSNALEGHPNRLAYWGWIRENGTPIQGPFVGVTQHSKTYFDYSHGFRAVLKTCRVNGVETPISEVLQNESLFKSLCGIDTIGGKAEPLRVLRFPIDDEPWPSVHSNPVAVVDTASPATSKRVSVKLPTIRLTSPWMRDTPNSEPIIARLQKGIGATADGVFGRGSEKKLKIFQAARELVADGICGSKTWAIVLSEEKALPASDPFDDGNDHDDELAIAFIQAKSYRWANRKNGDIDWIVIHTMEAAEHPGTAENVAAWFAGPNHPIASAHYNIDSDSIVQSVREKDIAHHAPGANRRGVGLEHAGYHYQKDDERGWQDAYSQKMIALSAKLSAGIATRYNIPIKFVNAEGLRNGERGITYHSEVSKAFKKSTHIDPGKHFPIDQYMDLVKREMT